MDGTLLPARDCGKSDAAGAFGMGAGVRRPGLGYRLELAYTA